MLSLRDKLKAAGSVTKKAPVRRSSDCLTRETRVPLERFTLPERLSGESLSLMQGREIPSCSRNEVCFLDTETTGLSHGAGTVAFLVGVGSFDGECFTVRQYLMRDYDEEIFLLQAVEKHLRGCSVLCSFNGATFDLPLLESRFVMNRMPLAPLRKPHIDLLPTARRVWKLRLRGCRLGALEEAVLGMTRQGDLPGALVPKRYFDFLKSKDMALLEDILRHNAQDIISLAHILNKLLEAHECPLSVQCPEDVYSLGRVFEKRGRAEKARMCYRAADQGKLSALCRTHLAESYRREGSSEDAERVYLAMISARQGGAAPYIALAKICEHKRGDLPAAIEYTQRAIQLSCDDPAADMSPLQKRLERLLEKARRKRDGNH